MIHDEVDYCLCASDAVFGNRYVASASFLVSTPVCYRRLLRTQKGATHPGCSSPFAHFTQYLTALRAWSNQCLPGRSYPDVLPPGIVEMRGSMVIRPRPCMTWSMVLRLRPCMIMSTPNPPPKLPVPAEDDHDWHFAPWVKYVSALPQLCRFCHIVRRACIHTYVIPGRSM